MRLFFSGLLLAFELQAADLVNEAPHHRQFVIGVSPFLEKSAKDDVYRGVVRLLVQDLPLDSELTIYDAFQIKSVTRVVLPNVRAFSSPKTRANQFAGAIQSLRQFLASDQARPTNGASKFEGAIRLPQFCDFLADTHPPGAPAVEVLLLGSPLYQDAKEPAFSMSDGYFPSDGHLQASRDRSVFGARRPTNDLSQVVVHWFYAGDPWINELHKEWVTRFWSLYVERRGARLVTLSGDLPTTLARFAENTPAPESAAQAWTVDLSQTKIEMLRVTRNVDWTDWITRDNVLETAPAPPDTLAGPIKIGIRWKRNIDLDLYAAPEKGAETLYFEHPRSAAGYYYKDHRSSPGKEFEFIEFETPVDVRQLEASVNFYEGSSPEGARGEVRIEFGGRIYSAPFLIRAARGNLGRAGRNQEDFWTRIPVQEILRLVPAHGSTG